MVVSAVPDASEYLREAAIAAEEWRRARGGLAAVLAAGASAGVTTPRLARAARLELGDVDQLVAEHRAACGCC